MSTASAHSSMNKGRINSLQQQDASNLIQRAVSYSQRRPVTDDEAYSYALRAAYLSHLLQPKARRIQHVSAPHKPLVSRSSTSINDFVKDFSLIRDSKSTRFPHGFTSELDKRITGVLIGRERMPEYNDPLVKRTFAAFLNEFKNPTFRKSMEKDRRVEDLLLIFYSKATTELQKGKAAEDDAWKLMVDRHVALFVRFVSSTLKNNDWARERPELSSRLQTLESKLLVHSQDLADASQRNGGTGGSTVEVEIPRSSEAKDMPMALRIANIFGVSYDQIQADIDANKSVWTEKAALQDLKTYQTLLSLNSTRTLRSDDFLLEDAYEQWKKAEIQDLSQMMLAVIRSSPDLARSTTSTTVPTLRSPTGSTSEFTYPDISRTLSDPTSIDSSSLNEDIASLNLDLSPQDSLSDDVPFIFIPPEPRMYYRTVLQRALANDLFEDQVPDADGTVPPIQLLSKHSIDILNELALRWRIPHTSRMALFLDVIRERYERQEISLDALDAAFSFIKEAPVENKKSNRSSVVLQATFVDPSRWTIADHTLHTQTLSAIHDALLHELFELLLHCYENKPPSVGPVMYILENNVYDDPLFAKTPEDLDQFSDALREALREPARKAYDGMLSKHVPEDAESWEFYNIIQLGKAVVGLADKIQKRYRKNPEIMGVNPLTTLVQEIFPSFATDARDICEKIMGVAKDRGEEVPIQDGFDLYKELTQMRQVHGQALPSVPFAFHIEALLADFVWRWIALTDAKMIEWIEGAVRQDDFTIKAGLGDAEEERHTVSAVDMFRSFSQSIDQIMKLEWDDDFQYAKFMTALSKSIGIGIARYCELLEQKFVKEMDRMTPEQEAAARQTRQERWMQMAKETWNNKEKVEPFQFLPESLVKLNDIEYTTIQLDKLEGEINVDACAAVIQQKTPPAPMKVRQTNKFVFTIKIIEAEDLKACDMNGLSDPYVVLGDEYQKRLAKTRIVYGSLNPRWDETVDISTQGPLNIIATIWDWDALGDHDCVGRTSLKLDPSHFSDYMPREFWLDLDTQGRLLLRVSMEGERDDIQFYFGKAFRTLKRTERDMTRKITDKLSSYIQQCLSRRALRNMLSQGLSISSVRGYFQKARPQSVAQAPTQADVANALKPLFTYFDDNFAIMKQTLTETAMVMVMTRLWKETLVTIESLLVPPLSDKPSQQRPLTQQELDIVFKWLQLLFDFFHAVDDESGVANGVPLDILKSPKYHDLQNLNFFYFESTENLIRTSESMAKATLARQQAQQNRELNRLSAPATLTQGHSFSGAASLVGVQSTRRSKSIMLSRNLGTMKKAKEEKRKEAQAEPSDDIILRILRMRPEAERYLRDRSRQKERLAAHAAAELIVRQSLLAQRTQRTR
ncbi:hypothetical protein AAFC00_003517 [Neodothiora populina]|uniref:C2 domain protein n=1 Tax=Neodothiora populina TaxID=2781224 RepID=A0ABR3PEM4_9PEZI